MAKHAYHDHLKKVRLFADLDDDELDRVAQSATQLDYAAGKSLMHQGGVAHEMFVLLDGTVEVTRDGEHIADLGRGAFVGEMALLTHTHRNASVTAKTDVSVLHIDGREFASVLNEVPRIAVKMLPVIAGRVAENAEHDHGH